MQKGERELKGGGLGGSKGEGKRRGAYLPRPLSLVGKVYIKGERGVSRSRE